MKHLTRMLAVACLIASAPILAANTYRLDIAPQPLSTALQQFAKQSGLQIVYYGKIADGHNAAGVSGNLTAAEALKKLLAGTDLQFETLDRYTVAISSTKDGNSLAAKKSSSTTSVANAGTSRLAQGETAAMQKVEISASSQQPSSSGSEASAQASDERWKGIPEILVQGKKSLNTDIQRSEDDPQPYVIFGREEIRNSQASSIEEFLNTRLPMNTTTKPNILEASNGRGNQSEINLRGLGANQTLVLVNGRRLPGIADTLDVFQPDINGIPMAFVERIEVLPTTAAAIYGGSATGGVINIVLRHDYVGLNAEGTYKSSFDTESAERRIDLAGAFSLEDGRINVLISASYSDTDPLLVGDREFARRGRELLFQNRPSVFYSATSPPTGYTSNIRSQNGSNLVTDNGIALNSNRTFVPVGYAGVASDGGLALVANAGKYNLDLPDDWTGSRRSLRNGPIVESISGSIQRQFGDNVDAFVNVSVRNNKGRALQAANLPLVTLPANASNNPFTTTIRVRAPTPGISRPARADSQTIQGTVGAIVRLPGDWMGELDHDLSRSRATYSSSSNVITSVDPDGVGPLKSGTTALTDGTLDVMRDVNVFPLDYSPYYLPSPNFVFGPRDIILNDTTLRLSGPLYALRGGPLALSALVEHRKENAEGSFNDRLISDVNETRFFPARSQIVDSYYAEVRAPLISGSNARRGMREFELQASVRHDAYRTTSVPPGSQIIVPSRQSQIPDDFVYETNKAQSTDYLFGVRYSPLPGVTLRASFGTGFLSPSVSQIAFGEIQDDSAVVTDPRRENVPTLLFPIVTEYGGNPNLKPEESKSWSSGVIFEPRWLSGFRLSVDYTRIEKVNEISTLSDQELVNFEGVFPGYITRGPNLADDPAGWAGPITRISRTLLNIAATKVEACDIQAEYSLNTDAGAFRFFSMLTWAPRFVRQATPTSAAIDSGGGFSDGPLEWRGNGGLTWDRGPLTLGWNAQYYGEQYVYASSDSAGTIETNIAEQGSRTVPRQIYHDVFVRYRLDESALFARKAFSNTEVVLGIQNIFDKYPPIAPTPGTAGYHCCGDPRLRRFSVSMSKGFQ